MIPMHPTVACSRGFQARTTVWAPAKGCRDELPRKVIAVLQAATDSDVNVGSAAQTRGEGRFLGELDAMVAVDTVGRADSTSFQGSAGALKNGIGYRRRLQRFAAGFGRLVEPFGWHRTAASRQTAGVEAVLFAHCRSVRHVHVDLCVVGQRLPREQLYHVARNLDTLVAILPLIKLTHVAGRREDDSVDRRAHLAGLDPTQAAARKLAERMTIGSSTAQATGTSCVRSETRGSCV
mmetsp:Transcript_75982/g.228060  ORF Transcript_75982/g.228060 Transcript_75982/m.228060 type:complete len:236 (-) Transcript_75982:709-1416(-)